MKKIILSLCISTLFIATGAMAQCDQASVMKSSKTEYLDKDGNVTRSVDEDTKIDINKKTIVVAPSGDHVMTGTITSSTCDWKTPFKDGKLLIKASFDENGEIQIWNLTIEGKDGKISFLAELEGDPNKRLRISVDSFEAAK